MSEQEHNILDADEINLKKNYSKKALKSLIYSLVIYSILAFIVVSNLVVFSILALLILAIPIGFNIKGLILSIKAFSNGEARSAKLYIACIGNLVLFLLTIGFIIFLI